MSDKKLAITIAGAVSLGAYEAGVAYELLQRLKYHNQACLQPGNNPDNQIHIDVLTGASAGAMTAAILAQRMLFFSDRLDDPTNNDLYLPWVKEVDLVGLLKTTDQDKNYSILSSELIEKISTHYITGPYGGGLNLVSSPPHPAADSAIHLGLSMSNLNGVTYSLPIASGGSMPYTRFQDEFGIRTPIDSQDPAHNSYAFWEPVRIAAIAAGAFPFAFRPKDLVRDTADYPVPPGHNPPIFPDTNMHFAYTDGGVFQNEPIGLAKGLVDLIDNHVNPNRFYMFISPSLRDETMSTLNAPTATLLGTAKALVNAIFNQSRYRDLEHIEAINNRIAIFDHQAVELFKLVLDGAVNTADLQPATQALLPKFFPNVAAPGTPTPDRLASAARLRQQFAPEYAQLQAQFPAAPVADQWIDAILLLEAIADLGLRDKMTVYAITDDSKKLAGAGMLYFAGFFDVAYRDHDYNLGRQSARDFIDWLNEHQKTLPPGTPCLGPIYLPPQHPNETDPIHIDHSLDQLDIHKISSDKREKLREQILDRAHHMLEEFGVPWIGRWALDVTFLKKKLDELLGL